MTQISREGGAEYNSNKSLTHKVSANEFSGGFLSEILSYPSAFG